MFCSNCGQEFDDDARFCKGCGAASPKAGTCPNCGETPDEWARFCNHCGQSLPDAVTAPYGLRAVQYPKNNIVAGLLAIFVGVLGVHKFYLGYKQQGMILLVGFLVSIPLSLIIIGLLGIVAIVVITFIEGILYLIKDEREFHEIYVVNRKEWF